MSDSGVKTQQARPCISIIMPAYNAEARICEAIESVALQSFNDFELICVDDGSTDKTNEIVRLLATADSRIRLINQQNSGAGAARNTGIELARGEFLAFVDADDILDIHMLELMYGSAIEHGADICTCEADSFDEQTGNRKPKVRFKKELLGRRIGAPDIQDELFQIVQGHPWGKLFRRDFILRHGLRFQEIQAHNDMFFVFSAYAHAKSLCFVGGPLVFYRIGSGVSLQDKKARYPLSLLEAVDALRDAVIGESCLSESGNRSFNELCINSAIISFSTIAYDRDAAEQAYNAAKNYYLPKWGLDHYPIAEISGKGLRFRYWCMCRTSFEGYIHNEPFLARDRYRPFIIRRMLYFRMAFAALLQL